MPPSLPPRPQPSTPWQRAQLVHTVVPRPGVSFEEVVEQLQSDGPLDVRRHPNQERYPHQRIFVLALKDYVCLVPFVEDEESIFLKTVIPSRKAKKELGR